MKKRISIILAALLLLVAGITIATAGSSNAGVNCILPTGCGNVYNMGEARLGVIHNFGPYSKYDAILPVGRWSNSTFGWSDTDGFYIGTGYCAKIYIWMSSMGYFLYHSTVGSGVHQIHDGVLFDGSPGGRVGVKSYRC